ncbi:hypothetical protein SKAU_G00123470 [Synaphobranchus kaupii]|uniref:Uncharacterized protein n=1 Tax=Synaphobranchus kaupii TaxID=118154 RepID=A0A9Q1J2A1_SYNKA|nr:hypothetical protein SKAU_G00123470 [Synaphobranchus kaupii]
MAEGGLCYVSGLITVHVARCSSTPATAHTPSTVRLQISGIKSVSISEETGRALSSRHTARNLAQSPGERDAAGLREPPPISRELSPASWRAGTPRGLCKTAKGRGFARRLQSDHLSQRSYASSKCRGGHQPPPSAPLIISLLQLTSDLHFAIVAQTGQDWKRHRGAVKQQSAMAMDPSANSLSTHSLPQQ